MNKLLDYVYDDFKSKVSNGRHMSPDQVEEVAKGIISLFSSFLFSFLHVSVLHSLFFISLFVHVLFFFFSVFF
jgi:hypothetical protein